jgi:class 3 adenylate cyclase/tetratricopeptide (TPR) repeat protein
MAVSRKTVTVLFADVADSTGLGERLDPESVRGVMSMWFDEARRVLEHHGGTVEKFIGDAVMAVFGVPQLHEDDAVRALRAAVDLRGSLSRLNQELRRDRGLEVRVRIGVNSGEVVTGDDKTQSLVTGDAVNIAKRLEEAARAGEVLVGSTTERLGRAAATFELVEPLDLKGKTDPVEAWRLVDVATGESSFERHFDTPLVGRRRELDVMRAAYRRAVADRTCQRFTLLGPPGVGKSRLACELFDHLRAEATVLSGRCLPYGDGITFWPLHEVLRELGGEEGVLRLLAADDDAELICDGLGGGAGGQQTFWAVRRLFETLGRTRPIVLCIEDVHWAEPTLLDLLEYLAGWTRDAPVLLLCLARPEFVDERPAWFAGDDVGESLMLEALDERETSELLDALDAPDTDARRRIVEAAEGNPLYVEQMVAMVAEGGYVDGLFTIPPTIQSLLAARLDRLSAGERGAIERAAVAGKEFWRAAVTELTPEDERAGLGSHLMSLVRRDFIRPHRSAAMPDDAFRFAHVLVRDAAYASIPKAMRADLHLQFANWLQQSGSNREGELDEIVGYHLEQGYRYREQLGPIDTRARELANRAGELLGTAGHRASLRGDMPAAVNLLARAAALLDEAHPTRVQALPELGSALMRTGDFSRADDVLTEALERAAASGDKRLELRTLIEREFFRTFTNPETSTEELVGVAEHAIPLLEELSDELGLAKAWWLRSEADVIAGRWGPRAEALERALTHARRVPESREGSTIVALLAQALEYGPTPVPEAIRRCEALRRDAGGDAAVEAAITSTLAGLTAMEGRFDEARRLYADAAALYDELGLRYLRAGRRLVGATIESLAGEPEAAVQELRAGYDELEAMGERGMRSTLAAYLAQAFADAGHYENAGAFATTSEQTGSIADVVTQAVWRSARARALAHEGELSEAERHAREAVELAAGSDFLELQATVSLALAEVLEARGGSGEATALRQDAQRAFERKGNLVAAKRLSVASPAR